MENSDIKSIREWAPLTEIIEKIPSRTQKGIFTNDLNITCVDVVPEFIALGTNSGIVFWCNRFNKEIQKLRSEVTSPITCIKIVSSVEYMVAAGSLNGRISIFQIQKEIPPDLNLAAPLMKSKPIERYTIRDLHKSLVTCCEWSKNGMKLFSGDKHGVVVLTEFDYQTHISKSMEILNEAYDIVQLSCNQSYLVVSTVYRSIVCKREENNYKWKILQIGKKDRKILSEFGATFLDTNLKSPKIICSRPGLRFWISDCDGNVEQTLLFKDAALAKPLWEIPLLNPGRISFNTLSNFTKILIYMKKFIITYDTNTLYILNLEDLRIEATARGFRKILDVSVCGKEIFILEGPRSLIRISTAPEPPAKTSRIIFNPLLPPPVPILPKPPIEFEAEEEVVTNAEECFELPTFMVDETNLDIPVETVDLIDSPTTQKNKVIIEQNKRIEIFDKINDMEFEEDILFSSKKKAHKNTPRKQSQKKVTKTGVVEIGQIVKEEEKQLGSLKKIETTINEIEKTNLVKYHESNVTTTVASKMEASFCTAATSTSDDIKTNSKDRNESLSELLNIEPIKLEEVSNEEIERIRRENDYINHRYGPRTTSPLFYRYPTNFMSEPSLPEPVVATTSFDSIQIDQHQTTPRKKIHFIREDSTEELITGSGMRFSAENKLSDANLMSSKLTEMGSDQISCKVNLNESLDFSTLQINDELASGTTKIEVDLKSVKVPDIKKMPYLKIPNLWNIPFEESKPEEGETQHSSSKSSNDWELL